MDLSIDRVEQEGIVLLVCAGRIDAETGPELVQAVADELRLGRHAIRLDLEATTFLSSAGISHLFETQKSAKGVGGTCFVRRVSPTVKRVLDLTRLSPLIMEAAGGAAEPVAGRSPTPAAVRDVTCGPVALLGLEPHAGAAIRGTLFGEPRDAISGRAGEAVKRRIPRHACGLGLAALADGRPAAVRAGELAVLAGAVFHRPPQAHAAVDYVLPQGDLLADVSLLSGVVWEGIPAARAGFEPSGDDPSVRLDDLVEAVLAQTQAATLGIVVAGEVHGLVGVELIRPLAEARAGDTPVAGTREVAATWLSFSREPVHARRTAAVVGIVTRTPAAGPLEGFVREVPGRGFAVHFHAVVFPYRPLRRGGLDLAATVADLAASTPLAVMHLVADPQPVLGSGRSEFARGAVWFAPLELASAGAAP
ncbi:MAG: STAS domain-containing protein [Planctomycetota bacterium]|nr:STAS domain-containing protein [Planctomycetota bacterium]